MDLFNNSVRVVTTARTINAYRNLAREGELYLNAPYQREYVWGNEQQQDLLKSIFDGLPIGGISVVINEHSIEKFFEVIDGRQRVTTIILFITNKIAFIHNGKAIYWDDLDKPTQRQFRSVQLPYHQLTSNNGKPVSEREKLTYFCKVNFGGTPQSEVHKSKVLSMLSDENAKFYNEK